MARVYATRDQLIAYAPVGVVVPPDPEATRLLTRASERVDAALVSAIYDTTTSTGLPTDPVVTEALALAVCAQALSWLQTGDESASGQQYQSVKIGSVALQRPTSPPPATSIEPRALVHLRLAGLLPGVVVHL